MKQKLLNWMKKHWIISGFLILVLVTNFIFLFVPEQEIDTNTNQIPEQEDIVQEEQQIQEEPEQKIEEKDSTKYLDISKSDIDELYPEYNIERQEIQGNVVYRGSPEDSRDLIFLVEPLDDIKGVSGVIFSNNIPEDKLNSLFSSVGDKGKEFFENNIEKWKNSQEFSTHLIHNNLNYSLSSDDMSKSYSITFVNTTNSQEERVNGFNGVSLANWNLQIFGQSKAENDELMQFYADTIDEYDIVFIQEIRDKSETAFPELCSLLDDYSCELTSRAGRTSSKEQYGIIYKDSVELVNIKDYNPDSQDRWERPPVEVTFRIENYTLRTYNIHTKPDDVQEELNYLEDIVDNSGNVVVLGDLNADCSYYTEITESEFDSWNWIVKNTEDTTVSSTDCAYDRILLNEDSYEEFSDYGIFTKGITKDISDHYLVWINLGLEDFKPEESNVSVSFEEESSEDISTSNPIVKKSNSGKCHGQDSPWYDQTDDYTSYDSMEACIESGGEKASY